MIPNYLYGFRCKCGCGIDRIHLSYFGTSHVKELMCDNCQTVYIRKVENFCTKYEIKKDGN